MGYIRECTDGQHAQKKKREDRSLSSGLTEDVVEKIAVVVIGLATVIDIRLKKTSKHTDIILAHRIIAMIANSMR